MKIKASFLVLFLGCGLVFFFWQNRIDRSPASDPNVEFAEKLANITPQTWNGALSMNVFFPYEETPTIPFDLAAISMMDLKTQMRSPRIRELIDMYLNAHTSLGNRATLLMNGVNAFDERYRILNQATQSIFFQSLTLMDDRTGVRFIPIIARKLEQGVVIRIMIDSTASWAGSKEMYEDLNHWIRFRYQDLQDKFPQFKTELERTKRSVYVYKAPQGKFTNHVIQHDETRKLLKLEKWEHEVKTSREAMGFWGVLRVMHTKMVLVDGKKVIIGGMNTADNYSHGGSGVETENGTLGPDLSIFDMPEVEQRIVKMVLPNYYQKLERQWGEHYEKNKFNPALGWRDTDVLLEGPIVDDFTNSYSRFWTYVERAINNDAVNRMGRLTSLKKSPSNPSTSIIMPREYVENHNKTFENLMMRKVEHIPHLGETYYIRLMRWLIMSARKSISCQMPYMVMSPYMEKWLSDAAKRGVKINLFTNGLRSNDTGGPMTWVARKNYINIERGAPSNVAIYEWQYPTIHSKTCVIDDYVTLVGSNNHDYTSDYMSSEIAVTIYDEEMAKVTTAMFEKDKTYSQEITMADYQSWYRQHDKNLVMLEDFEQLEYLNKKKFKHHFGMGIIGAFVYNPMKRLVERLIAEKIITH